MSSFNKVSKATANSDLDLTKHVNYTSGMILGVDDFTQEFAYLAGRDRWLARDALGFGTVSGLQVTFDKEGGTRPRVMVLPGVALSPRGQLICVSTPQCAYLNEWLAANLASPDEDEVPNHDTPPLEEIKLYIVLCYRDCAVDRVPVPGEPCRSEDEILAASRIQDDFLLELRLDAPAQPEEETTRAFVAWLRQLKIVETGDSTPLEDFKNFVRARWLPPSSPPIAAPPAESVQVANEDALEYLRTAFRLWATELRAVLTGRKTGCAVEMSGGAKIEDCVLLAELDVPLEKVTTGLKVHESRQVALNEENRPVLLHLRMLQEWIAGNPLGAPGTSAPPASPVALSNLEDVRIESLETGQVLIFDGSQWVNKQPETGGGGGGDSVVTEHKNLLGLGSDDHRQYLLTDGSRAMAGSLDAGNFTVRNVKAATGSGEAVTFEQLEPLIKKTDEAQGDLSGQYREPKVVGLQGNKIAPGVPPNNSVLMFRGGLWTPSTLPEPQVVTPAPAQRTEIILPLATVTRTADLVYEIWFNIDAPGNLVKVLDFSEKQLQIHDENDVAPTFLTSKFAFKVVPGVRNVFVCTLAMPSVTIPGIPKPTIPGFPTIPGTTFPERTVTTPEPDRMRFRFDISAISVEVSKPREQTTEKLILSEFAEKNNIKFAGSLDGKNVTVFVRGLNK